MINFENKNFLNEVVNKITQLIKEEKNNYYVDNVKYNIQFDGEVIVTIENYKYNIKENFIISVVWQKDYYIESTLRGFKEFCKLKKLQEKFKTEIKNTTNIIEVIEKYINDYFIYYQYDLMGLLELKKINKKTITCIDSLDKKHYLKHDYVLNNMYKDCFNISIKK